MNFKLPRGVISHDISESLLFFTRALFGELDNINTVQAFEKKLSSELESEYCTSFSLARTAIYFILRYLDHPPGTKILLSPITIKGILDVVVSLGYVPVYLDIEPDTYVPSDDHLDDLESEVKVAIITPLYGVIPDLENISNLLTSKGIYSILDFSHCFGGRFKSKLINNFFNASVYSSSSIKILDTLGGGHVLTSDKKLNLFLKNSQDSLSMPKRKNIVLKSWINFVRNLATERFFFSFITFPVINFISKFLKVSTLKMTGDRDKFPEKELPANWFNRFSSLQADIGLKIINKVSTNDRLRIECAREIINGVGRQYFANDMNNNNLYWQLIFVVQDTLHFQKFCLKRGVDIATSSLLLISDLQNYEGRKQLTFASNLYDKGCLVPCNFRLKATDRARIVVLLKDYIDENS